MLRRPLPFSGDVHGDGVVPLVLLHDVEGGHERGLRGRKDVFGASERGNIPNERSCRGRKGHGGRAARDSPTTCCGTPAG